MYVMANEDENGTSTFGVFFQAEGYIFLTEDRTFEFWIVLCSPLLQHFVFFLFLFFFLHFPQNPVNFLIALPICVCVFHSSYRLFHSGSHSVNFAQELAS